MMSLLSSPLSSPAMLHANKLDDEDLEDVHNDDVHDRIC